MQTSSTIAQESASSGGFILARWSLARLCLLSVVMMAVFAAIAMISYAKLGSTPAYGNFKIEGAHGNLKILTVGATIVVAALPIVYLSLLLERRWRENFFSSWIGGLALMIGCWGVFITVVGSPLLFL